MAQGTTYTYGGTREADLAQQTYFANYVNREDLEDVIANIDPWETPMLTSFPKTRINHVVHEWVTDTLGATSTAGAAEGADFDSGTLTQRGRKYNNAMIFRKDIHVTNTQRAVDPVQVRDEAAYQVGKALKEIARNIEIFIAGTSGRGETGAGTGTARVMKALSDFLTTGSGMDATSAWHNNLLDQSQTPVAAASASATLMLEGRFNDTLQLIFDNGGDPDKIFVSGSVKRQISAFSGQGASRRNIQMTEKKLVASVDVYDSDFGLKQVILDRWVPQAANTATTHTDGTGTMFFLESGMQKIGVLRPIRPVPIAAGGDSSRAMVLGELTLIVMNEGASGRLHSVSNYSGAQG